MVLNLSLTRRKLVVVSLIAMILVISIILLAVLIPRSQQQIPKNDESGIVPGEPPLPASIRGEFEHAAVASDADPCAAVGRTILKENGSAVDSAIATLLCMGVYNGQSMGLGGGFLMTIYDRASGKVEVIDARETAPGKATEETFAGPGEKSQFGPLSVAVPGEIKGYEVAHERHGRLKWPRLFDDAIRLATEGFPVSLHLHRALKEQRRFILQDPSLRAIYVDNSTGDIKKQGQLVHNFQLAASLRAIADNGAFEMYGGDVASRFVDDIQKLGGIITIDDMKNYQAIVRNAASVKLRNGLTVYSAPPPGSGAIFNFILKTLEGYDWNDKTNENNLTIYQAIIETFKYGFAFKSHLGDPAFSNLANIMDNLTSTDLPEKVRKLITLNKTFDNPLHYGANGGDLGHDYGTAHASVVAENGDAVSVTSTINYWFGAGLMSPSTGIILNNEMDDFTFTSKTGAVEMLQVPANHLQAGKRPLSSMSPSIFVNDNGDAVLTIGAAGGSRIITGTAMTVARLLWFGLDIKDAIDKPRVHHQLEPNHVDYESGIPQDILDGLRKIGHKLEPRGKYGSVVVGIHRNSENKLIANYDYRKGGSVDGY